MITSSGLTTDVVKTCIAPDETSSIPDVVSGIKSSGGTDITELRRLTMRLLILVRFLYLNSSDL